MALTLRPRRYLLDKTRRHLVGILAKVGTGGSVAAPAQTAINEYVKAISGSNAEMLRGEKQAIRDGMKRMQGSWLLVTEAGLRWASGGASAESNYKAIKVALRNSGWDPPDDQVRALLGM